MMCGRCSCLGEPTSSCGVGNRVRFFPGAGIFLDAEIFFVIGDRVLVISIKYFKFFG